ncbi:MAG: response regulator [Deltaproteobacteria bacterium]|jgi:signal transduction histidine kinase/CheY-like chemotaxis protein|nr:response regulator [Deltaproteobacteria bacterium]
MNPSSNLPAASADNGSATPGTRIKRTFLWFSIIILLAASAAVILAFVLSTRQTNLAYAGRQLRVASETLKLRLSTAIESELVLMRKLADTDVIRQYFLNPSDNSLKNQALSEINLYQSYLKKGHVFWLSLEEKIVFSTANPSYNLELDNPNSAWVKKTLLAPNSYFINTDFNSLGDVNSIWLNVPVFSRPQPGVAEPLGVVGAAMAVAKLSDEIAASYQKLDKNLIYYIYNSNFQIIAAKDSDILNKNISILDYITKIKDNLLDLQNSNLESTYIVQGNNVYLATKVLDFNWNIVVTYQLPEFVSVNKSFNMMFFSALAIFILLIVASNIFISRSDNILAAQNLRLIAANRKAERASKAKTDFLAHISHEIRTPLNAIIGMSELILREDTSVTVHDNAQNVRQAGKSLLAMINDLLDLSKIEAGIIESTPSEYWLGSLIGDVVSIISLKLSDSGLTLILRVDPDLPSRLIGDEIGLRTVLLNLLTNAAKYTERGSITVTVRRSQTQKAAGRSLAAGELSERGAALPEAAVGRISPQGIQLEEAPFSGPRPEEAGPQPQAKLLGTTNDHLEPNEPGQDQDQTLKLIFEVADTGIGIREENLKKLFDSYSRFDRELNRDVEGTGLGLAITKKLVMAMGGEITVSSVYGQGSVFTVGLDQKISDPSPIGEISSPNDHKPAPVRFTAPEARILIVDDIATNLKIGKGLLASYEAAVDLCDNGREAINLVKKTQYDLIFMDRSMPGLDGPQTTQIIRNLEGEYFQKVPVVALSADIPPPGTPGEEGFSDRLLKPIDLAKLDAIMERFIPKEKRRRGGSAAKPLLSGLAPLKVSGLDYALGLARSGGDVKRYLDVLSWFCRDGVQVLEGLADPAELKPAPSAPISDRLPGPDQTDPTENRTRLLQKYAGQLHAIKSAAAGVGAAGIAEEARVLEAAAKKNDWLFVSGRLAYFKKFLAALIDDLSAALAENNRFQKPPEPSFDPVVLDELRKALEAEDIQKTDDLLSSLGEVSDKYPAGRMINLVADQVLRSEFGEAAEILTRYLMGQNKQ